MKERLKKRCDSFKYAFNGIYTLFATQPNAKIHAFFCCLVIGGGFFFQITVTEWLICILAMTLVLSAEAFNTALEFLTDLVSPDYHPLAGKTKDVAAGAVLIAAIGAALIGFIVFLPKVLAYFL